MPFQLNRITLCVDDFSRPVDWSTEVLGVEVRRLNIEVEGFGFDAETPASIPVMVTTRPPSLELGLSSIPVPLSVDVGFFSSEAAGFIPGRMLFRGGLDVASLAIESGAAAGVLKVATIVRPAEADLGAPTSDGRLRVGLTSGVWTPRGRATQRPQVDPVTSIPLPGGDQNNETPDALRLLRYGGLEVLEVRPSPLSPAGLFGAGLTAKALVRSRANVIYYSGHGLFASRCLAIHRNPAAPGAVMACWAKPADLIATWLGGLTPSTVIIAGCSVLSIALTAVPLSGPGVDWLPLLRRAGGPVANLLGYGSTVAAPTHEQLQSPADEPVGNDIAQEFGVRLSQGSNTLVQDWLRINAEHRAWNAVAIDGAGLYWTVTQDIPGLTAHTLHSTQLP